MSRFKSSIKTKTLTICGEAIEFKSMGHGSMVRTIARHDGMLEIVEDAINKLIKASKGAQTVQDVFTSIAAQAEANDDNVGAMAAKMVVSAPDLVYELIIWGVIFQPDETPEQFEDWLDQRSLVDIVDLVHQWFEFNFEGGVRPFVQGLKEALAKFKRDEAPAKQEKATSQQTRTLSRRAA